MDKKDLSQIDDFDAGMKSAMDPYNDTNRLKNGEAITTISSAWLHTRCNVCGHTFRIDDPVAIAKEGDVRHNSALLPCSGGNFSPPSLGSDISDFYDGILETYKPPKDLIVVLLSEEIEELKSLLAPPIHGFKRHECSICSHTIRPSDIIVLCPCHPKQPRCRVTIHWDPFRGLNCWGEWESNQESLYCPATSEPIR